MAGLVQNSNKAIFKNYKKLYEIGENSLSPLQEAILPYDWSKIENKSQMRLLSGIVSLINDINEENCREITEKIITKGCTLAVKQCLNSITSFSLNNYISLTINNMQIYVSNDLKNKKYIKLKLEKWLSVIPEKDLQEIDRIYIIPYHEDYSYSGTYIPILSYITLVWDTEENQSFFWKWAESFMVEQTLYHEIGHHKHNHTFGQDHEQEDEADEYARKFMKLNHPYIAFFVKFLKLLGIKKRKNH